MIAEHIDRVWDTDILPALVDYIRIPNQSPHFDPEWRAHGHMDRAVGLVAGWCGGRRIPGLKLEVVRLGDRTPVVLMDIPGTAPGTVLLYGHLDKQPAMEGWLPDLGPWTPVLRGERLYGRGGADDGYAAFASLTALESLAIAKRPHPRCVVLIEACEESGSVDLPAYVDHLATHIGRPDLVVCLDSGCGDYERLWGTTSLRGIAAGTLTVEVLREGVHSGDASGVVPSTFRIARALLERLEHAASGAIVPEALHVEVPADRLAQAKRAAAVLRQNVFARFPWASSAGPVTTDPETLIVNRTWQPALEVIEADGVPSIVNAGNVLRPRTVLKLSLRIPPTLDADRAITTMKTVLEANPPYGARVRFEHGQASAGWNAPPMSATLEAAITRASETHFGTPAVFMGEGGTIPFMGMLGERFPQAQFLITGVLGPESNAHGPNEFLHLPTAKRLTACVADVIAAQSAA